jgi:hypothetical protein
MEKFHKFVMIGGGIWSQQPQFDKNHGSQELPQR